MADTTMTVTVTSLTPLLVLADGADTSVPCATVSPAPTVAFGDRAQVTVRTPQMPLLTAKV